MNKFDLEYRRLNLAQKKAVDEIEGPVMVIAGPGTGKTQILAMRVANILRKTQIDPSNILALTFTNSGVYQMRKRLLEIIGAESYNVHVHTFHSFCNEIINTYPEKFISSESLNQLDDLEQVLLVQKILTKGDYENLKPLKSPFYYDKTILKAISDLKQEGISPKEFENTLENEKKEIKNDELSKSEKEKRLKILSKNFELAKIYYQYQENIEKTGKYDYADMILHVLQKFKSDNELLSIYQEKFQYILVDEYQDTNSAQNEIVKILASFHASPNLFVVGDDEQSIFRFQGASIENVLFFTQTYSDAKIIVLTDNYRSTQEILDISRAVISNNQNQIFNKLKVSKNLKSVSVHKGSIFLGNFSTSEIENYFVAKEIQKLIKAGVSPSEVAVIFKEHKDAGDLIEMLSRLKIPYHIEAGNDILSDPEIRKIIQLLNIIENPSDDLALLEILHFSFFQVPVVDIYKLANHASVSKKHIFDLLIEGDFKGIKLSKEKRILKFTEIILDCQQFSKNNSFAATFDYIINQTGYLNFLLALTDAAHHLNRLQTLFEIVKKENLKDIDLKIKKFLDHLLALRQNHLAIKEKELTANYEGVKLMTAHKAKGLEFTYVFIIHLTDQHWGNAKKRELIKLPNGLIRYQQVSDENDEEERRLFYVALTRARKSLYLTYATSYDMGGINNLTIPSKFVSEIPEKLTKPIPTLLYEKNFDERLRLSFGEKKWTHTQTMREFLDELIEKFALSATSLNAYLDCPRSFLLNQLLRVPKVKDFNQSYGTAVHRSLEDFFKKYKKDLILPKKEQLIKFFADALKFEIFTEEDFKRAKKQGSAVLEKYYDFYKAGWLKKGPPISCEYTFKYHNVHFGNILISGIIDKAELLDKTAKTIKVIDYKTSSPKSLNQLLGKTKEQRMAEYYQAYFYKLLAECDPLFKWEVESVEFDFVSPRDNKFSKVEFKIENKEFEAFKELVRKVYSEIKRHQFDKNKKHCTAYNSECEYLDLCE